MEDAYSKVPRDVPLRLKTCDFEHVLERLIALAEEQGRDFFAYLLTMALIHLRDENREELDAPN